MNPRIDLRDFWLWLVAAARGPLVSVVIPALTRQGVWVAWVQLPHCQEPHALMVSVELGPTETRAV